MTNAGSYISYKEIRSLMKNKKISQEVAQNLVQQHINKHLRGRQFVHKESQKEGVIQMD